MSYIEFLFNCIFNSVESHQITLSNKMLSLLRTCNPIFVLHYEAAKSERYGKSIQVLFYKSRKGDRCFV